MREAAVCERNQETPSGVLFLSVFPTTKQKNWAMSEFTPHLKMTECDFHILKKGTHKKSIRIWEIASINSSAPSSGQNYNI